MKIMSMIFAIATVYSTPSSLAANCQSSDGKVKIAIAAEVSKEAGWPSFHMEKYLPVRITADQGEVDYKGIKKEGDTFIHLIANNDIADANIRSSEKGSLLLFNSDSHVAKIFSAELLLKYHSGVRSIGTQTYVVNLQCN